MLFQAVSDRARRKLSAFGLESWQMAGPDGFYVEHRPARDLADVLAGEGFTLTGGK